MKKTLVVVGKLLIGAAVGYLVVMLTLGWFVDGAAFGALLAAGMVLGAILAITRGQRVAQTP